MTYIGIIVGGVAGFLYWKFVGCTSGACPLTSNKFISIAYGALLGSLLLSTVAGSTTKQGFFGKLFGKDSVKTFININAEELKPMINDPGFVVIDVRTPGEWKSGYIAGTDKFIDFHSSDFENQIRELDNSKAYVIYCRSGNRSAKACEIMSKNGFTNLHNLSGGINKWDGEIKKD
ncbi:MAG: rhodanese-like domain-containing protein [Ignavibacteria bacterium]|nr:rhodanese-like domain-containing protein [Ignavibacteria bacterium]